MKETSKCYELRHRNGDFRRYLRGDGLDVGGGDDGLRVPEGTVVSFDKSDGDGQYLQRVPNGLYDFVYSSHCLEHLRDIPVSLTNWLRVLKRDGFLYIVVPDYVFYEKMRFPSMFNGDHKHTFSQVITRQQVKRNNHWHLDLDFLPLLRGMGVEILETRLELDGFDFNRGPTDQTLERALSQLCVIARKR